MRQKAPIKKARKEDPSPRSITVYSDAEWKALSSEAQTKIINERKKAMDDADDERSAVSAKSSKSIKSLTTKTLKAFEKDNRRLKNSFSALQKCDEDDDDDDDDDHLLRDQPTSKR